MLDDDDDDVTNLINTLNLSHTLAYILFYFSKLCQVVYFKKVQLASVISIARNYTNNREISSLIANQLIMFIRSKKSIANFSLWLTGIVSFLLCSLSPSSGSFTKILQAFFTLAHTYIGFGGIRRNVETIVAFLSLNKIPVVHIAYLTL